MIFVSQPGPAGADGATGSQTAMTTQLVNSNITILAADTIGYYYIDTTAARTITLPLAASYAASGARGFHLKDYTGSASTFNITINRAGADTIDNKTNYVMNINNSSIFLIAISGVGWLVS